MRDAPHTVPSIAMLCAKPSPRLQCSSIRIQRKKVHFKTKLLWWTPFLTGVYDLSCKRKRLAIKIPKKALEAARSGLREQYNPKPAQS
jgi:hypothetical protein